MNIADIPTARNSFMKLRYWLCKRCIHGTKRRYMGRQGTHWVCAGHNQLVDILDDKLCRYFEFKKPTDDALLKESMRRWKEIFDATKRV